MNLCSCPFLVWIVDRIDKYEKRKYTEDNPRSRKKH